MKEKRRAIKCELERKSSSNPGYYKYNVTIREKDGSTHKQPAYGKDMQDALSRLLRKEITVKVENKVLNNPSLLVALWLLIMGWPAILSEKFDKPIFLLLAFAGVAVIGLSYYLWMKHLDKGD